MAFPFDDISIVKDPDFSSGQKDSAGVFGTIPQARLLLVEDFGPWRETIRTVLRQRSQIKIIGEVSDGLEAVQKARVLKPDIILLDIGLPLLDSFQAASRIKGILPATKIIFVTQYADAEIVRAAMSVGVRGCVFKLDVRRELLQCIESVCRGERYISSELSKEE